MDKLDLCGSGRLKGIFKSRDAKLKVKNAKERFDMQENQILPVANYINQSTQDIFRDVLALQAIENILQEAAVYINSI